jgi:orotate phosphoribosyltransferase
MVPNPDSVGVFMRTCQKELAQLLAESQALFFEEGLSLKDGRPTPYFVNFGLFRTGRLIAELGRIMADFLIETATVNDFDVLVGPSYKGSALAVATVQALWANHKIDKNFDYNRKEAKTHGEGSLREALFVTGALTDGVRVLIIDDVATTMNTKFEILGLLSEQATQKGYNISSAGVALFLDRQQTTAVYDQEGHPKLGVKGQDAVKNFRLTTGLEVQTILGIRETVEYLSAEKIPVLQAGHMSPLKPEIVQELFTYLDLYGV